VIVGYPTVSVIVPAYNAAAHITRALDSVLAQTLPVHEIVVADDGSTDGTPDLVEKRYGSRVRLLRLPHTNAARTRVEAVRRSRGEWIAFLDSDDYWLAEKNERQAEFVRRHPETTWLSSDGAFVQGDRMLRPSWLADYFRPVREVRGDLYALLAQRCYVLTSSTLVRRAAYDAVGGMDPEQLSAHDYDLWLKLAAAGPGAIMPDRLILYSFTPGSLSTVRVPRLIENIQVVERLRRGIPRHDLLAERHAARRLTGMYWSLALQQLKQVDPAGARVSFRTAASAPGPWGLRLLCSAAALIPGNWSLALRRLGWARRIVREAQYRPEIVQAPEDESSRREATRP
jgi:glycosyltransferase involved in cell wall biosynthesis